MAEELARALEGRRVEALRLDGDRRDVTLLLEDRALVWALHPLRGWPRVVERMAPHEVDFRLRAKVMRVLAPADERVIRFELTPVEGRPLVLVVELMSNQWNALLLEGDPPTIRHVLWRRDGPRLMRVGEPYAPPRPMARAGVAGDVGEDEWRRLLADGPEEERAHALVRAVAWTSPLNAETFLGAALASERPASRDAVPLEDADANTDRLAVGHARWKRAATGVWVDPVLLDVDGSPQPYPFPLAGFTSRPAESLLAAFAVCASGATDAGEPGTPFIHPALVEHLESAARRARARVERVERELAALPDPARLRATGDLILARYADIPHGATSARLLGFDGEETTVELEPGEAPHDSASRYYRDAARAERAAERLPRLLEEAKAEKARADAMLDGARRGTLDEDASRALLAAATPARPAKRHDAPPSLPYRAYRSSGGLEIRVGRGARYNDELTFKHSSPGDVWLHARHVGGAHVILRWTGPGNPPARDLAEAATLAAWHSKARTSGSVPVDWTFRKYVRKPRKSPPGRVAVERVQTLFVRPNEGLLRALAVEGEDQAQT